MCLFTGFLLSAALISCELLQLSIINLSTDTQYLVYLMTQFFLGFSSYTYMVVSYVILVEIVSQKYSVVVTMIKCQLYVSGEFVLLAVSYYFRDWHLQNWFIAGFSIVLYVIVVIFLPESPRWAIFWKIYEKNRPNTRISNYWMKDANG